ncbi:MAG: dephospho-CoA kinase [Chitinophagaceae bacterium]|jgi:dephospho-CoA kinase|nr:dephospho-CoA kinase [Chitinophagaceae bacterium]
MLKVGLTGGIGSGKTTVANIFEVLGIPVYNADERAKELMHTNELLKQQLIFYFGEDAYADGHLNRKYLSSIVFADKEKLELLNSLVHPVTIADAAQWFSMQTSPYVIKEAALLFESGTAEGLDYVIGVTAPVTLRLKRVMDRDHVTAEEVKKRMLNQIDEQIKIRLCDFVIQNNEQQLILPQVFQLHEKLILLSEKNLPEKNL